MTLHFSIELPRTDIAIGVVAVEGVVADVASDALRAAIQRCVEQRQGELSAELEGRRVACRQMLRNGTYKPTGRGKPASEYLLRSAHEGSFPAVNGLVDANNLVSLQHMVPISVWDLDLSSKDHFVFRLGTEDERYVFNQGGQELALRDLLCGCELDTTTGVSVPIVNAIKDCLRTKTTDETTRVAAAVYCPLNDVVNRQQVEAITVELREWLSACGTNARSAHAVVGVGDSVELELPGA